MWVIGRDGLQLNRDRDATLALFELIKNQPGY
jgi:hypothetical protein